MKQYINIDKSSRLSSLINIVGERNIDYILAANNLARTPSIGQAFFNKCQEAIQDDSNIVNWQRKSTILNTLTESSDVFETAALLSESGWKVLSKLSTFPNMLLIPDTVSIPTTADMLGNGIAVGRTVYDATMHALENAPHYIQPSIFNEYSATRANNVITYSTTDGVSNPWQMFPIPWGDVSLYSSLAGTSLDIPAYPEELSDGRKANYTTMPDLVYTYEPWYLYQSSGPRSNTYQFNLHRDMWSGDHSDGKANELIRFCEACCYPRFTGSVVNAGTVSLYVKGRTVIHGIVEDVNVTWDGPILQDGWYAHFTLELTITEVSEQALDFDTVRAMPLIGQ